MLSDFSGPDLNKIELDTGRARRAQILFLVLIMFGPSF